MIEAIVFDKDGTLFDFQATWCRWADLFLDRIAEGDPGLRQAAAEAIGYESGVGFHPSSVAISEPSAEIGARIGAATGLPMESLEILANQIAAEVPQQAVPGLVATLEQLGKQYALGLVTNDGEAPARQHLQGTGILHHFDFVAGYDSGHGAKPGPGQLLAFSEATRTRPERSLMVGDSRHDLAAGRAAGMGTVAVLTGVAVAADLEDLADVILPDMSHLPAWIGEAG